MLARSVITVARRPNVTKRSMSGHGSAAELKKEVDNWKKYSIGKCDYFFCDIVDNSLRNFQNQNLMCFQIIAHFMHA